MTELLWYDLTNLLVSFLPPQDEHQLGHKSDGIDSPSDDEDRCLSEFLRGWRNTIGNLIEFLRLNKAYHGLRLPGKCVKHRGYGFIEFETVLFQQTRTAPRQCKVDPLRELLRPLPCLLCIRCPVAEANKTDKEQQDDEDRSLRSFASQGTRALARFIGWANNHFNNLLVRFNN